MAVYEIKNMAEIAHLYKDFNDTMVWSCLQNCMGTAYANSPNAPTSAQISVGDFCFFAGEACLELVANRPSNLHSNFAILGPPNRAWEKEIEAHFGEKAVRHMRFSTKKEKDVFDKAKLKTMAQSLAPQYTLKLIDHDIFAKLRESDWAADLCSNYGCYKTFANNALGFVVLENSEIVAGASAYTYYNGGIEIEIDTREDCRRKGLATACGAALILECLERDLYPSWDAHTKDSLELAKKFGYHLDKEYLVYLLEYDEK